MTGDFDENGHLTDEAVHRLYNVDTVEHYITFAVGGTNLVTIREDRIEFGGPLKDNPTEMAKLFMEYVENNWNSHLRRERSHD